MRRSITIDSYSVTQLRSYSVTQLRKFGVTMVTRVTIVTIVTMLTVAFPAGAQEDILRPNGKRRSEDKIPSSGDTSATIVRPMHEEGLHPLFRLGVEGGINLSTTSRDVTGTLATSPYMVYESGSGVSPLAGLYAEIEVTRTISIGLRILYDAKVFSGQKDDVIEDCPVRDLLSGYVIGYTFASLSSAYETSVSYITISPVVRWSPFARLFIQFGPVLQVGLGNNSTTLTETMDDDESCRFTDGTVTSQTRTENNTSPVDPAARFGIDLALGYQIPLASWLDLVPRIGYQWMFTPYTNTGTGLDDSSQYSDGLVTYTISPGVLQSLQATLSLWFVL